MTQNECFALRYVTQNVVVRCITVLYTIKDNYENIYNICAITVKAT